MNTRIIKFPHLNLTTAQMILLLTSRLTPRETAQAAAYLDAKLNHLMKTFTGVRPNNKMANARIMSVADRQTTEASGSSKL